jgi:hypothetical protein
MAEPASDFETACYSGGQLPSAAAALAAVGLCAEYSVHAAVLDDRIDVTLRSGTLCAGCTLDLGVDDALVGVWHARWLPLLNAGSYKPAAPDCDRSAALPPAPAPEAAPAAAPQPATALPGEGGDDAAAAQSQPSASRVVEVAHAMAAVAPPRVQLRPGSSIAAEAVQAAAPPTHAPEAPMTQLAGAAAGFAVNVAALVAPIFAPPATPVPGKALTSQQLPPTTPTAAPGIFSPPPLPPPAAGVRGWLGAIFAPQPPLPAAPAEQAAAASSCALWQAALFRCTPTPSSPRPAAG